MFPARVPVPTWTKMRAPSAWILRSVCHSRTGLVMFDVRSAQSSFCSAGTGAELMLCDAESGDVVRDLGAGRCAAYRADGAQLVTGSALGTLRIMDVATGAVLLELDPGPSVDALACSADGRCAGGDVR